MSLIDGSERRAYYSSGTPPVFVPQFDGKGQSSRFFIIKPDAGCQGRGIFLTQSFDRVSPMEATVAQQYIRKPLLIDGFKFDLRLYVLVTSCVPLRVFMFHDGLVRLCTQEYVKPSVDNVADRCMHLTNYAINKHNDNFQANEDAEAGDVGSKRSLKWFMDWLSNEKGEAKAEALWRRMGAMSVKVLMSILPTLTRDYESTFFKEGGLQREQARVSRAVSDDAAANGERLVAEGSRAFEILGIDVMIDSQLKPWLIEINHLPSFATDSPLDQEIKSKVVAQVLGLCLPWRLLVESLLACPRPSHHRTPVQSVSMSPADDGHCQGASARSPRLRPGEACRSRRPAVS
jgi:tubulin polyglutamylase TTLL6/13